MSKDKYVGKVVYVIMPNSQQPRWRWVVKKREDGRYIVRAPKNGVKIRNLKNKSNNDYKSEQLLPKEAKFWQPSNMRRRGGKRTRRARKSRRGTRTRTRTRKTR